MSMPRILGSIAVMMTLPPLGMVGHAGDSFAVRRFNYQVAAYMTLRHHAEQRLQPPVVTSDPSEILANQTALARAIRKARPRAQAGDIFDSEVSAEFRSRIQRALAVRNLAGEGVLADLQRDAVSPSAGVTVNGSFDWRIGATMPAAMVDALPVLPSPLEYRFVCGDLLLLDIDASLIVDILPAALSGQ